MRSRAWAVSRLANLCVNNNKNPSGGNTKTRKFNISGRKMKDVEQVEVGEGDHVVVLIVGEEGTGDGSEKG